jgi:Rad3-related DNA helicase
MKLDLNEVLALILPEPSGHPTGWQKPDDKILSSFPQAEGKMTRDFPLQLSLKHTEGELIINGICDEIRLEGDTYFVTEEILLDRMVEMAKHREKCLIRARFLALALAHAKSLPRVGIRLAAYAEGRVEIETAVVEKEALSHALAPHLRTLFSLSSLWKQNPPSVRFPYPSLREGQKALIEAAWNAIKGGHKLFACAPTGIGKTLAVLYPALRALEKGKATKVFYAAPKNTLKMQAMAAVNTLQEVRTLRTLVLSARMSLCPQKQEECLREGCPFADSFATQMPLALAHLSSFDFITEKELLSASASFGVYPFELALKLERYCQVVIGDYNHIVSPDRAIFSPKKSHILLVDEAHNLPGRIREGSSETLSPEDLDFFFHDPSPLCQMLKEHLAPLTVEFAKIDKQRNESREYFSLEKPVTMTEAAKKVLPKIAFCLHGGFGIPDEECNTALKLLLGKLKHFIFLSNRFDATYATIFPPEGGCRIHLIDPRETIRSATEKWKSVLFFSATLSPESYFFDLLAGEEADTVLTLPSPFPRDNLFVGICPVDVSYNQRFLSAPKLCRIIHSAVSAKEGNYMVFLPSFEYLNLVSQEYKRLYFSHRLLIQKKQMSPSQRKAFLKEFEENRKGTLIGFCVMGGIFSEGVDLKGESLSGEIIVGTGFPPPSPEAEAESASYYKREMDGKSLAYTLPGWNRVLQAAGRVIRSETDRGFLILCDQRYLGEDMRELFPEHWEDARLLERDALLKQELEQFWK